MIAKDKHQLLEQLCLDAHWLDVVCGNAKTGPLPALPEVSQMVDLARKANASAQAFSNAMFADVKGGYKP